MVDERRSRVLSSEAEGALTVGTVDFVNEDLTRHTLALDGLYGTLCSEIRFITTANSSSSLGALPGQTRGLGVPSGIRLRQGNVKGHAEELFQDLLPIL